MYMLYIYIYMRAFILLCSWWVPVKMFQLVYLEMRTRCVINQTSLFSGDGFDGEDAVSAYLGFCSGMLESQLQTKNKKEQSVRKRYNK